MRGGSVSLFFSAAPVVAAAAAAAVVATTVRDSHNVVGRLAGWAAAKDAARYGAVPICRRRRRQLPADKRNHSNSSPFAKGKRNRGSETPQTTRQRPRSCYSCCYSSDGMALETILPLATAAAGRRGPGAAAAVTNSK